MRTGQYPDELDDYVARACKAYKESMGNKIRDKRWDVVVHLEVVTNAIRQHYVTLYEDDEELNKLLSDVEKMVSDDHLNDREKKLVRGGKFAVLMSYA